MANVPYDYINQSIVASAVIQPHDIDSFYNPAVMNHTGFAADGTRYTLGVQDLVGSPPAPVLASWFTETPGLFRSTGAEFPSLGLILLSKVALTIIDQTNQQLNLWMQFIMQDQNGLTNNFDGSLSGFTPSGLTYADGLISVIYSPDEGNINNNSHMVVTMDFVQDQIYLDITIPQP